MTDESDNIEKVRQVLRNAEDVDIDGVPVRGAVDGNGENTVTHLRSDPSKLDSRARYILDTIIQAGDCQPQLQCDYLWKGWLNRSDVSVLYGPSNSGKSFLALKIADCVSKGQRWGNRRVKEGRVLCCAAEGGGSFTNRVAALEGAKFMLHVAPIVLTGGDSLAQPLAEVMQHLEAVGGAPFDLIIFDTMARVMGTGDENNAPDIADLTRNIGLIQRATGAHVMLIHHSGKDTGRGARGHSALRAAIDTEIELTRDDLGQITAEVTKQRDGPTGYRFVYNLRQVELGEDQDGDIVTTCLVEPADAPEADRVGVTGSALGALELLKRLIKEGGKPVKKAEYLGSPCIEVGTWREACIAPGVLTKSTERDTREKTFRRAREALTDKHFVKVLDDLVWVVQR